jgi:Peptidase family M28
VVQKRTLFVDLVIAASETGALRDLGNTPLTPTRRWRYCLLMRAAFSKRYRPAFGCLAVLLVGCLPFTIPAAPSDPIPQPPQRLDPMIQKIVSEISDERIAAIMRKLETFETRNTLSDPTQTNRGIGAARDWLLAEFKSCSPRLDVRFDTHTIPKAGRIWKEVELRNVVAILPGKLAQATNRWIIVSGHYDSINLKDAAGLRGQPAKAAELPAPGVSDDASGVACALECARVLSQYDFDATLVFVAFAGEEQGLIGAHALARRLKAQDQQIEAVLNNDIIGTEFSGNGSGDNRRVLVFSEDPDDSTSRQLARFVHSIAARYYPEMTVDMIFRRDRFGRGGDQTAFNEEGYAGVRFTTPNENFADQHSATDTFTNASVRYTAKVVRINAAAAAALALAPKPPVTVSAVAASDSAAASGEGRRARPGLTRGVSGYDAVLRWDQPEPESDPAGFIVVVRSTTAPDWEREIWAGNVREFTLKNTPIDQLVFGVKAVDRDGHESPVAAYVLPTRAAAVAPAASEQTPK